MTYYFDVLPLHPRPEYLESLTSYLMRLAEYNGISSMDGLSALCFPHQDRRITRGIADYPPVSFGDLTRAGTWSEEILRTTTFFHLAAKFRRSTLPQPVSRFLSGCVGQYLRYCPACFAEQRVRCYLLPWRFLMLTYCCKHMCRLLETCGHCDELIPLFTSPFKLGNCPRCQQSLKLCATALVSGGAELEVATYVHDDIVLVVEGMERGDFQGRGATLQSYIKYAHHLCLSLKEVFSDAIDTLDHVPTIALPLCSVCQQSYYVTRCGYNRSGSQRYRCQHCHRSFTPSPKAREVKRLSS